MKETPGRKNSFYHTRFTKEKKRTYIRKGNVTLLVSIQQKKTQSCCRYAREIVLISTVYKNVRFMRDRISKLGGNYKNFWLLNVELLNTFVFLIMCNFNFRSAYAGFDGSRGQYCVCVCVRKCLGGRRDRYCPLRIQASRAQRVKTSATVFVAFLTTTRFRNFILFKFTYNSYSLIDEQYATTILQTNLQRLFILYIQVCVRH